MNLSELIKGLDAKLIGTDVEVRGLSSDSRTLQEGDLFFALKGQSCHGNHFVYEALSKGAVGVVTDIEIKDTSVRQVVVEDTLEAMAYIANRFYGEPSRRQKVIGVTGTNGKTTTAWLIYNILKMAGWPVALLGTVNYIMPDGTEEKAGLTTPQSIRWQALLSKAVKMGAKATVAEVSSHGLALKRVAWSSFSISIFTNLSRDHLDFHKDMEDYFQAKAELFRQWTDGAWVINIDDPYGARLAMEAGDALLSYGLNEEARFRAVEWDMGINGLTTSITDGQEVVEFRSPLLGMMNLYNILGAVATTRTLGIGWDAIRTSLEETGPVSGRLQKIETERGFTVIIDYAHTPDALQKVLEGLRPLCHGRLICIFGCGGNRDRGKRPIMGRVASELSDLVIVTSDNPRWEEPEAIIKDITEGIERNNYKVIPDRRQAISEALSEARESDIVLIAGKGHEDYQEIKGKKLPFSDHETVMELLQGAKEGVKGV